MHTHTHTHTHTDLVVDGKVADLHGHGDEVDGTVQFVLLKLFLQVNKLIITAPSVCVSECV